jgi:nucleotide-binding universal stress UspA family protein
MRLLAWRETTGRLALTPHDTHPILLCYDGSAGSRLAIERAAALFPGQAATVLHVWTPLAVTAFAYGAMMIPAVDEGEIEQAAMKVAEEGAALASELGLVATPEIAEATYEGTWHAVVESADAHDAVLIAIGARGLSTFKSLFLGSVSHGVVQHAARPVLVVPPAARADQQPTAEIEQTALVL